MGRKILLHLLNQSSQTLCVYPYSPSLRNEGSTVLLSTKSCCAALHGEQTQIWHSSSLLANGQGAQGVWKWLPCFIWAWRDIFYCQVSFSSALGMKSKKENKNTVYPPIQNRLQWKKMNSKQPFSNDSFLFPNALKGEGLHPKSPNHFGNRSS